MIIVLLALAQDGVETKDRSDQLKAQIQKILKAISDNDRERTLSLTRALRCDEARFKKALREDVSKETVDRFLALHKEYFDLKDDELAKAFSAGDGGPQEMLVHAATTEELIERKQGGVAWERFAGGTQKVAQQYLRPKTLFYSVKIVKPGETSGMTYHLFFFDGEGWGMIGKAWRLPAPK